MRAEKWAAADGGFAAYVEVRRAELLEMRRLASDGQASLNMGYFERAQEAVKKDPRYIAAKAENYLKQSGIGDTAFFGPEAEFFVFSDVRFSTGSDHGFYSVDSPEASWNSGSEEPGGNLGYKPRSQEGYFPTPPNDSLQDVRSEMCMVMKELGITIEAQHHEVATAGQ